MTRRIAAVISADQRFAYFGTSAFAIRLLRLKQKIVSGVPRVSSAWRTFSTPTPHSCRNSVMGFRSMTLCADGQAMEVPIF
jgi:hypothetical protein